MNLLLIGDSITEGFPAELYPVQYQINNKGHWGHSSAEVLEKVQADWCEPLPDKVIICLGTNDLARCIEAPEIIDNICLIAEKILEYCQEHKPLIFLASLFPTRHNPPRPNPVIDRFNALLHQKAIEQGYRYLHLNSFFKDKNGQLHLPYTEDGLHLTKEAYQVLSQLYFKLL